MNSKKLYEHALHDFGLAEQAGSKSNPRIQNAIQRAKVVGTLVSLGLIAAKDGNKTGV